MAPFIELTSYINFNTAMTAVLSCLWHELSRICGKSFTDSVTKSGQTPLFGVTGLRASLLSCQRGTSVFWQMSNVCSPTEQSAPCSPSEVTVSVMVQVKSGDRDGGRSGVIPVSNPAAETERGKSSFLCFSTRPAITVILWITHLPCAFQRSISLLLRKTENWILTFLKWLLAWR